MRALIEGKVNAANIFSTSPAIPQNHLVVLDDPQHNFLAGNIVPLVNSQKKSDRLKDVLDAVSAKLTSRGVGRSQRRGGGQLGHRPRPGSPELDAGQRLRPSDRELKR